MLKDGPNGLICFSDRILFPLRGPASAEKWLVFHPHRQDVHRHAAVRTTDRCSGSWLNGWREHNPQQAVIPHPTEPTRQHMLDQQPEELPTWQGLDDILAIIGFDAKGDLAILVR